MTKSADAFRTISEVAEWLGVQTHVLRFWESKFTQVKPVKRAGGRRYYRPADMLLLGGIRKLLHEDGLTIKGVQKILREEGMAHVADMSPPLDAETDAQLDADLAARIAEDVTPAPAEADIVPFETPPADAPEPEPEEDEEPQSVSARDGMAPLPSFLQTGEATAETADDASDVPPADEAGGLPYAPLVEDVPASSPEYAASDGTPLLAEEEAAPENHDAPAAFEPEDSPPEPVDTHMAQQTAAPVAEPDSAPVDSPAPLEADAADRPADPTSDMIAETDTGAGATDADLPAETEHATAAEDEPQVEDTAPAGGALPSFLSDYAASAEAETDAPSDPMDDAASPEAEDPARPAARVVDVPDDPAPDTIAAAPSALSKASGLTHLSDAQRSMIRPLLAQLVALRDQMASNRREPR